MSLIVDSPGLQTLVQDGGRHGHVASGVGTSGAFDRSARRQANALVGNPADAAVLEVLGGGLRVRAEREHLVAVTGAVGPLHVDGRPVEHGRSVVVFAGQQLALGSFDVGLRGYLAVSGGVEVPPVLGSRSTDTLADLGPPALAAGDELPVGAAHHPDPELPDVPALITSGTTTVEVIAGPRDDWFTTGALATFGRTAWTVSPMANRVGLRLDGPALDRRVRHELPSEPCVCGSVQVTTAGLPVVLGPDHPISGGYPVIAVVVEAHLDRLAQVRPGETLRFQPR